MLLSYFGETSMEACGNCDVCLDPPELVDGTVAAQKLLSCVYRLWKERSQRFGAGQAIDILRGKRTEKVAKWRHDELSVFGVGADLPESAWRGVLRHLIALGMLEVDHETFGTLVLTQGSRAVLKGERRVMLRRQTLQGTPRAGRVARSRKPAAGLDLSASSAARFDRLRQWRASTARSHGVPAYVIFHDATLREIAEREPQSLDGLAGISGIGARKLESYGADILALMQDGADDAR